MIHTVAINKDGYDMIYLVLNYYKYMFTKKGVQIPGTFLHFLDILSCIWLSAQMCKARQTKSNLVQLIILWTGPFFH